MALSLVSRDAHAQGIVDLRLVGPASPIIPGDTIEVKLRATRQDPNATCSFSAIDCIVGWNPADLQFLGISTTGSVSLMSSYLPAPANDYSGINELAIPQDGNLLYTALAPLGQSRAVPAAGVQIVTFRFKSISTFTLTTVSVIDNLNILYPYETAVIDGVVPGVDDFGLGYAAAIDQLDCNTIFWYRDSDGDGAGDPSDPTTSCTQPAGYVSSSNDLCPTNSALLAPVTYYADNDGDGFGAAASPSGFCATSAPSGYAANSSDCDDTATMYADGDGDGFGAGAKIACGGVSTNTDCNNSNAAIYPGAVENCNNLGVDNDCDSINDAAEATDSVAYYVDGDVDGFGAGAATMSCSAIAGSVTNNGDCDDASVIYLDNDLDTFGSTTKVGCNGVASNTDCNDNNAVIYPGAVENCNNLGVDNDCDLVNNDAEAIDSLSYYTDGDSDNYGSNAATAVKSCSPISGSVTDNTDCDDSRSFVNPGAPEVCDAANRDEDCDSLADNNDSSAADAGKTDFYVDGDGDTFGAGSAVRFCDLPSGYSASSTDCNDGDAAIKPTAQEICDGSNTDEDCDGAADNDDTSAADAGKTDFYVDGDGDTFGAGSAVRFCDLPSGYSAVSTDCNDLNAAIKPTAQEICDGSNTDEDCDGAADNDDTSAADAGKTNFYVDVDGDTFGAGAAVRFCDLPASGYSAVDTDCNDGDAAIKPTAQEICDASNTDEDCDGAADNDDTSAADAGKTNFYVDGDGDTFGAGAAVRFCDLPSGYSASSTDCNDGNAAIKPTAQEICDAANTDEDCDGVADNDDTSAADAGKTDFYVDSDNDNYGTGSAVRFCDEPALYALVAGDCDDSRSFVNPGAQEVCDSVDRDEDCDGAADNDDTSAADAGKTDFYVDSDNDNYGTGSAVRFCDEPALYALVAGDCDDSRSFVNPGAQEICDSVDRDEDCDALADNSDPSAADAGKTNFYVDADNDNYGTGSAVRFCDEPALYALVAGDCDDGSASVYPGAAENCANLGIDNDCDLVNNDAEASDSVNYYVDGDIDGFGAGAATKSCSAIPGSVTNNADCDDVAVMYADGDVDNYGAGPMIACGGVATDTDCDDADPDVHPNAAEICGNLAIDNDCDGSTLESEATDRPTWYQDLDHDNVGDATVSVLACSQPTDYVSTSGDTCPGDPLKLAPLGCGCGNPDTDADADGNPDCFGTVAALSLAADQTYYAPGEQVVVRASMSASGTGIRAASLSLVFDASRLEFAAAAPVAGSAFATESSEVADNVAGSLRYVVAVPSADPANTAPADLVDIVFNVRAGATFCAQGGLVDFGVIAGASSSLSTTTTVPMLPTDSALGAISLISLPPSISGAPAPASVAADAGSTFGAFIAAPVLSASDYCGGAAALDLVVTYPGGATAADWPLDGMFPIGVTTLEWTATDVVGQTSSVSRSVTVANHQLLDVSITLFGGMSGNGTRSMRVKAGASTQVFEVPLTAGVGSITGVEVPVASAYGCLLVKDPQHSLSKSAAASVNGVRYDASFTLTQGDSNNDDFVDILDFGIFVGARGPDATRRSPSNFNCDLFVNNSDFSFIGLNFMHGGDSCGSYAPQGQAIDRISVRELRRRGLGHLVKADLNGDGWVDTQDIAIYMQR